MKKKCKVVMLTTDEEGSLNLGYGNVLYQGTSLPFDNKHKNQHLYIVSEDKIKESDFVIQFNAEGRAFSPVKYKDFGKGSFTFKKVIATTDSSLTYVTEISKKERQFGDGELESVNFKLPLPQPSKQFIEHFVSEYNKGNVITEVMVEFEEELVPDYIVEGAEKVINILKINQDNTINIDVVKDSYSREEVEELIYSAMKDIRYTTVAEFNKWIEENL